MSIAFYKEQTRWPFVHAVVALALYFATRNIVLSLLLIYVWESIETVIGMFAPYFREDKTDSLLGDPLIGGLSIFSFWVLDQATGWDVVFRGNVSDWRWFWCFFFIALGSPAVERDKSDINISRPHYGTLLYTLYYTVVALAFYLSTFENQALSNSVLAWLVIVNFYALVAGAPLTPGLPLFIRVLLAEVLVTIGASIALIVLQSE